MNRLVTLFDPASRRLRVCLTLISMLLMWVAQPPLSLWAMSAICLVPAFSLVTAKSTFLRADYLIIWFVSSLYWLVSLQGIRHANPAMYVCLLVLAAYLGIYFPLFIAICRRCKSRGISLAVAAPLAWVGLECLRNYFATGISAAMLGHTLAPVPVMIQTADLFGSYGVSFVLVTINVAFFTLLARIQGVASVPQTVLATLIALVCGTATFFYGQHRLRQPVGQPLATFALIQRSEPVEYQQDTEREIEIFSSYARDTILCLQAAETTIDAVVWPESMYTGSLPWMILDDNAVPPASFPGSAQEFPIIVEQNRQYFQNRSRDLLAAMAASGSPSVSGSQSPHLIVGCGVARYGKTARVYSGMVHITPDAAIDGWYGKNHLVMFGEYVPLIPRIPIVKTLVPEGLGVTAGEGPQIFTVGETRVLPNICIETAVERVTINHLRFLRAGNRDADVVVTVTNDGWFDQSSVISHHLRCAQFVAVGARRPLLSAANNGPTVWVDSCGRIVEKLDVASEGSIIASPQRDVRQSLYVRIGDWPARFLMILCFVILADLLVARFRHQRAETN